MNSPDVFRGLNLFRLNLSTSFQTSQARSRSTYKIFISFSLKKNVNGRHIRKSLTFMKMQVLLSRGKYWYTLSISLTKAFKIIALLSMSRNRKRYGVG